MRLDQATQEQLQEWQQSLEQQYQTFKTAGLNLDLTRGKPGSEQLELSNELDGILAGNYKASDGTDLRNYGGLNGIPEAKQLFSAMIDVPADNVMIGGNGSLTLMYFSLQTAMQHGLNGPSWIDQCQSEDDKIKFLCPVPGYDRHFSVCEHLGIELIPVAMDDNGPDMDKVEELVKADPLIKGIWCVPRFSNPTGTVYSGRVVERMAQLGKIAGEGFRIMWDNAYAVHIVEQDAPQLANVYQACLKAGTEDSVLIFGSTSKITFAGAGVAFVGGSKDNLATLQKNLGFSTIGPDKVNQMRHVRFLKDADTLAAHMNRHAELLKPRFDAVLNTLQAELADSGMASWTHPLGGYFISLDTLPGLASEVVALAAEAGVKLTPAGATFPYGRDPENRNIRLAPSFPSVDDVQKVTEVFVTCLKLASVRQKLAA